VLTFALTYFSFFLHGGTLKEFLGVQKYIYFFYSSSLIDLSRLVGSYLQLIFTGDRKFWTEGYPIIHYSGWSIIWPILFVIGIFSIFKLYKKVKEKRFEQLKTLYLLLVSFFAVYNLFLFVTPIYPRYLLFLFVNIAMIVSLYTAVLIPQKHR
jgi:hypothetical protein